MAKLTRIGVGPRLCEAVIHGDIIYLSGQVADKAAGQSVAAQTTDILGQIDRILADAGTDKTKIIEATIWLADISTFAEMNSVWDKWVPQGNTPSRACVEAKLARPDLTVEIRVNAAL
ncbi:RidA family protein [Aliidongia dinghuensis]|nr:RidA family protein [Aliidongia dinghuensis]